MDDFASLASDQNFTTLEQWGEIKGDLAKLQICQPASRHIKKVIKDSIGGLN